MKALLEVEVRNFLNISSLIFVVSSFIDGVLGVWLLN